MTARTGIPSLQDTAHELCRLLAKYSAIITTLFPDNADLLAALAAASVACSVLEAETKAVREYGD